MVKPDSDTDAAAPNGGDVYWHLEAGLRGCLSNEQWGFNTYFQFVFGVGRDFAKSADMSTAYAMLSPYRPTASFSASPSWRE